MGDIAELIYDPRRPATMADPFPAFRRLRQEEPVHWSPVLRGWVLTRYRDVRGALFDPQLSADRITPFMASVSNERRAALRGIERLLTRWAVFVDPPDHTRLRGLMNKAFTPRAVEALAGYVADVVERLIDAVARRGEMDLIADFAYPLPATVIAAMLGAPEPDISRFKDWSDDLAAFVGSAQATVDKYERAARGMAEMDRYFRAIVAARRGEAPRDDVLGGLIAASDERGALSEDELVATAILLLFAGHETTTNLIANGMLALLRHPDQLALLRARPELAESAVEEFLRYDGPAASVTRVARADFNIDDCTITRGDRLFLMLNAANRDPEQFADPERLDIARESNRHIAFGYGPHYCIGAPLARLEARIAFQRLLARLDDIALAEPAPEWSDNLVLRGVKRLRLRFRSA
ncbi:MAG: cytochrome P450 [Proteobacteria bacterium]|nr:cytochrome P450 [Pseudomonadota bacterium]